MSGLETDITVIGICRADHATPLYPQKLTLPSLTSGDCSVGIVRSRAKATIFFLIFPFPLHELLFIVVRT
jgi:hypothetical protein